MNAVLQPKLTRGADRAPRSHVRLDANRRGYASHTAPFALTRREREVLGLLAVRLTNAEIAAKLGISRRTAECHVGSILAKLGAANRREAWRSAARLGLGAPSLPPRCAAHADQTSSERRPESRSTALAGG